MKRHAINRLQEWKEDPNRLPLIIRGARQVGKTWLMQEFGRTAFERCAYINFDRNERMQNLFSGDFDVDRILRGLAIESGMEIDPENTLIILDEIQEVPAALQSLKYFCANVPDPIVAKMKEREPENSVASWAFRFAGTPDGVLTVLSGMT